MRCETCCMEVWSNCTCTLVIVGFMVSRGQQIRYNQDFGLNVFWKCMFKSWDGLSVWLLRVRTLRWTLSVAWDSLRNILNKWNVLYQKLNGRSSWIVHCCEVSPFSSVVRKNTHLFLPSWQEFQNSLPWSKSFRPDQLFKVTEIKQLCCFST
jgi:hypothetical protein